MTAKIKTIEIDLVNIDGAFSTFFKKMIRRPAGEPDFDSLLTLRHLLSHEKAKIMSTIKTKKPKSIYELKKMLNRDFKSVLDDIRLLKQYGFIDLVPEKSGKRDRLRPVVVVENILINIKI